MSHPHYYQKSWITPSTETLNVDVCVYGASSAGVVAGIEARRRNKSVVVLQPGKFIGGLTTGGLGWTDHGRKAVIGGLSREFYKETGKVYSKDEEFLFDPHAASAVYEKWIKQYDVPVRLAQYLDKVQMTNGRITEISLLGGLKVKAKMFIDASYEGDLLAKAGVTYTVGRESNSQYNETLNGIYVGGKHQFSPESPVDPYLKEGDPSSGLLPGIEAEDLSTKIGQGDKRVQAYNFRMSMTNDPELKVDWVKPKDFDPKNYILAGRWFRSNKDKYNEQVNPDRPLRPAKFDAFPNKTPGGFEKTDTNNHGAVSSDFIGQNHAWPEAGYEEREKIFQAHYTWQMGLYWFVANSEEVPDKYRKAYSQWGLPKDEFQETGHWPHQLYVREARRMVSDYVITEADCKCERISPDPVAMGSYGMDSHNCTRFVKVEHGRARVLNEGDVQIAAQPYGISYRCIVPRKGECQNLLVPVCLSSSHIAYGSARMEPVFMALGQSASAAACHAIDSNVSVQDVDYPKLREELLRDNQVLELAK